MKREPILNLIRSVIDCFTDGLDWTVRERFENARDVIIAWYSPNVNWDEIALAIYIEALFTECCFHDWACFVQSDKFDINEYFDARRGFALRAWRDTN